MARNQNRRFTGSRSWLALLIGLLAACHLLAGCMTEVAGTGDETHTGISISGRILDREGNPFPGAVVSTVRTGLADTTEGDGRYHIRGRRTANGGAELARASFTPVETLLVTKSGKEVARLPVRSWITSIADLQVARYTIRGTLRDRPARTVARARATVSAGAGVVRVVELSYDSATLAFEGDFYLPYTGVPVAFAINVTVLGRDGQVVARAPEASLDSRDEEIAIPTFPTVYTEARGALRVAISDVPLVYEDTVVALAARAWWDGDSVPDSLEIASWEWKVGDEPWRRMGGAAWSACSVSRREPGEVPVAVRVRGADGQDALASIAVGFLPRPRLRLAIAPLPDSFIVGDTLRIEAEATDSTPGATTTLEMKWGDGAWTAVERLPAMVMTKPDSGTRIVFRARSEAPGVWAGPAAHYQVAVEDTLVLRVQPAPIPVEWDFEDEQGVPVAGFPGAAVVFSAMGSMKEMRLYLNRIAPVAGERDLEFAWFMPADDSAADSSSGRGRVDFVGFEMPLHRGFDVDLARQLRSVELQLRTIGGGADLRIGLVSPEYPLEAADSDFGQNLLGWDVRLAPGSLQPTNLDLAAAAFLAGASTVSPFGQQVVYDDALRARVLARVTALRITVLRSWAADAAADSAGLGDGAIRIDDVRFAPLPAR